LDLTSPLEDLGVCQPIGQREVLKGRLNERATLEDQRSIDALNKPTVGGIPREEIRHLPRGFNVAALADADELRAGSGWVFRVLEGVRAVHEIEALVTEGQRLVVAGNILLSREELYQMSIAV
jgi:hypothetical protein